MRLLMYTSEYVGNFDRILLDFPNIIDISKRENDRHGITGILFYDHGRFVQIMEGEDKDVRCLMENIRSDTRHKNVKVIIDEPVAKREMKDWKMLGYGLHDQMNLGWINVEDLGLERLQGTEISSQTIAQFMDQVLSQSNGFIGN